MIVVLASGAMLFAWLPPGSQVERSGLITSPFSLRGGKAWSAELAWPGDTEQSPTVSRLMLHENDVALGPPHSQHDDVASQGAGRFSHWNRAIVFSSTDGSDPNTNGRRYEWRMPVAAVPRWCYWLMLALSGLSVFGMTIMVAGRRFPRLALWVGAAGLVGILVEGGSAILLEASLETADDQQRMLFERMSAAQDGVETTEGSALNYLPHPYLGFALNPDALYGGVKQYDSEHLIRRSEKPRPRNEVSWRLLVLGGSTTFGAGVQREDETWVRLLERELRERIDASIEVINGGVGGYNIIENALHYELLLQKLDPDVVLLVTGVNDVHPRLIGALKPDYSNARKVWDAAPLARAQMHPWLAWSHLHRLLLWQRVRSGQVGHIYAMVQEPYPPIDEWRSQLDRNGPAEYERHLENLVRRLTAEGRRVVVVPQPWLSRPGHPEDEAFGVGVEQHNEVGRRVARRFAIPIIEQADAPDIRQRRHFWDAVHFNEAGSRAMAELMAAWIVTHLDPARRPRDE